MGGADSLRVMSIRGVMFDFSGTLFRLERDDSWLDTLVGRDGAALAPDVRAELAERMTVPPGYVADLDEEHRHAWEHRDLDPALHRKAYVYLFRKSGVRYDNNAIAL
jgi:FMN phosphatase YigB (HAD superfamily)